MKKIVIILALTLFSITSFAGQVTSKITVLGAATVQYGIVVLETPALTKPACATEFRTLSFDKSTSHGRDIYSTALAGLIAQNRLIITYDETLCGLWGNRALVTRIDIRRN